MAIGRPIELTPNIATKNISSLATDSQTQFTVTGGYRINEIAVYRNGVRLAEGRDFTASDGDTVNLVTAAEVDDVIEFAVFDSFNISDAIVSAASTQTLNGDFNITGNLYAGTFRPDALVATAGTVSSIFHVGTALTADAAGNLNTIGIITATKFAGNATGLTGTPNISAGTIGGSTGTFSGAVNIDDTTDSTSVTTGALIVDGGVGIAKNVYIGAGLSVAGTLTYEDVTSVDSVGLITAKSGVNITGGQLQVGVAYSVGAAGVATALGFVAGTSGLSGTLQTAAQANVTSLGTLTGLTVSGDATLTGANYNVVWDKSNDYLIFNDNAKAVFGTGEDLEIYHSGSDNFITADTQNLILKTTAANKGTYIQSDDHVWVTTPASAEVMAKFIKDGAVELNFNDSKKFETTNNGSYTTGIHTATASLVAGVNADTGVDLRFRANRGAENQTIGNINGYWNDTVVGQIRFMAGEDTANKDDGHLVFYTAPSGTVAERLRITSAGKVGIDTTAPRCALDLGDNDHTDGASLSNTPADYQLGVHAAQSTTGDIGRNIGFIALNANKVTAAINSVDDGTNDTSGLLFATGNGSGLSERLKVTGGGDVEFYGTAAGVASCFWDASANSLIFNDNSESRFGDSGDLRIWHDGTNTHIVNNTGYLNIQAKDGENSIFCQADGEVNLYHNSSIRVATTSTGAKIHGGADSAYLILTDTDGNYCWQFIGYDAASNGTGGRGVMADADGDVVMDMRNAGGNIYVKNSLRLNVDDLEVSVGVDNDLKLYHDASNSHLHNITGTLRIRGDSVKINNAAASKNAIVCESDIVTLYYDNSAKLATTNDGVSITGIATFSHGCDFNGLLREKHKQVDAKLSADANIDLEDGMLHYYSVNETTTATPNIRYNSSFSLNNKMTIGETVTVTIIYKPNGAGYYAALNVDGSGVTEEWNGGSAPSSANASGYDILTHTLFKVGDASFLCFSNVQNYA